MLAEHPQLRSDPGGVEQLTQLLTQLLSEQRGGGLRDRLLAEARVAYHRTTASTMWAAKHLEFTKQARTDQWGAIYENFREAVMGWPISVDLGFRVQIS